MYDPDLLISLVTHQAPTLDRSVEAEAYFRITRNPKISERLVILIELDTVDDLTPTLRVSW